jgi:hypothetical protein
VIDYEQVQDQVNLKYDQPEWQKDILNKFGIKFGDAMKKMHAAILKARFLLEHRSIEGLAESSATIDNVKAKER